MYSVTETALQVSSLKSYKDFNENLGKSSLTIPICFPKQGNPRNQGSFASALCLLELNSALNVLSENSLEVLNKVVSAGSFILQQHTLILMKQLIFFLSLNYCEVKVFLTTD